MNNISCPELLGILFDPTANLAYHAALHSESTLNLAIILLSIWALFRWTPSEMQEYRWFLLNVALSIFLLDIWNTFFFAPVIYIDAGHYGRSQIVVATGFLSFLGTKGPVIGYLGFLQLLGNSCVALSYAFLYRYCAMSQRNLLRDKCCALRLLLFQAVFPIPMSWFYLKIHPLASPDICCPDCVRADRIVSPWICLASYAYIGCLFLPIIALIILTIRSLNQMRDMQSNVAINPCTYKLQKQLIISLTLQFVIPFILLAISLAIYATSIMNASPIVPNLTRLVFLVMSSHTSVNGLVMLFTIRPYRNTLLAKLHRQKAQKPKPVVVSVTHLVPMQQKRHWTM